MSSWKYACPNPISPSVPSTAPIDEQRGLVEVALLTGPPRQFDQPHLDLGMTADALDPARAELRADMVGGGPCDLDESVGARGPPPRHGRLQQVTEVVQLVPPLQVAVPRLLSRSSEHRVEVAVGLLRRPDDLGQAVDALIGIGRAGSSDLPRHRLHQLVDIGVGEHHAAVVAGNRPTGGVLEVGHPTEALHPVLAVGQRGAGIDLLTPRPRSTGDLDLVQCQRTEPSPAGHHRTWVGGHLTAPFRNPAMKYFCSSR